MAPIQAPNLATRCACSVNHGVVQQGGERRPHAAAPRWASVTAAAIAVAALSSLAAGRGCARRIVPEIAATYMSALLAGFGCALRVFCEVAFATSVLSHCTSPLWSLI
jgi:hypothetical protein